MEIKSILTKSIIVTILLVLAFGLIGCKKNNEAELIADKIVIPDQDNIDFTFSLPKVTAEEAFITWESSNVGVITIMEYPEWDNTSNKENLYKALVTMAAVETDVTLTATVVYGEQTATKDFAVQVMASSYVPLTIAQVQEAENNQRAFIVGTVVIGLENCLIVKDETGYLYIDDNSEDYEVGDIVRVWGTRHAFNGLPQLNGTTSEKIDEEPAGYDPLATITGLSVDELAEHDAADVAFFGTPYYLSGIIKSNEDEYYPFLFTHPVDDTKVVRVTRHTAEVAKTELGTKLDSYNQALVVIYGYYQDEFSVLVVPDTLEEETYNYTTEEYLTLAIQALEDKYAGLEVNSDVTLDATIGVIGHEASLTWVSQNTAVVANDGKVTLPDVETTVEFEVTLDIGGTTQIVTLEMVVQKFPVSPISSLVALTPDKASDPKPTVLIEGVVIGHQYKGYWVADETGAVLVWLNVAVQIGVNAPAVGTVVSLKGGLTTYGEANSFTTQIAPIGTYTVLEKAAPTTVAPTPLTFDTIFGLTVTTHAEAKAVAQTYYGKQFTITGTVVRMGSDNYWKIQDPTNAARWFRMNSLGSNVAIKAQDTKTVTITIMVREIYFANDTSAYDNYRIGTFGGIYLLDTDIVPQA